MYLSRLTLDASHPHTYQWLGDCHALHRVVMSGFPAVDSDRARAALGVLFRLETPGPDGNLRVLVQSRDAPHWAFETRAVRTVEGPVGLERLEARFVAGARFRFRLRANPTRRVHQRATLGEDQRELDIDGGWREREAIPERERTGVVRRQWTENSRWWREREDGKRIGKRVELRREEDRIAWLARRGREHDGFALLTARLSGPGDEQAGDYVTTRSDPGGRLYGGRGTDRRLTFGTALFEGHLRVTDPAPFREAFETGVGPGKAFGCGLLSLAAAGP